MKMDVAMCRKVMRCYGTFICVTYIASMFQVIKNIFSENISLLTLACFLYSFGFTYQCINARENIQRNFISQFLQILVLGHLSSV